MKTLPLVILIVSIILIGAVGSALVYFYGSHTSVQSSAGTSSPTRTRIICSPSTVSVGQSTSCIATVTDISQTPTAVAGTVTFATANIDSTFTTSATCTLIPGLSSGACSATVTPKTMGQLSLSARYNGEPGHSASNGPSTIVNVAGQVSQHLTSMNIVCTPPIITVGQSISCTVTVTDISSPIREGSSPTGMVSFADGVSCTVSGTTASSTCKVSLTPSSQFAGGQASIFGSYAGDTTHRYSSTTAYVTILEAPCQYDSSISSHVYDPSRLRIVKQCVAAQGMVEQVIEEADGDVHIRLMLDPAYSNLTNTANDQYQFGKLVVEIICAGPITQPDAVSACRNYTNTIHVPNVGRHITLTGPYVLDMGHQGWAEIHPVYSLTIGAFYHGATVHVEQNLSISYPGGATTGWLGPTPRTRIVPITVEDGTRFSETRSLYSTSIVEERITSITISTPGYSIVSIYPATPIIFAPQATVEITLSFLAPDEYYHGPIELNIVTAPPAVESLVLERSTISSGTNMTLYLRNTGTTPVTPTSYYVKDPVNNQYYLDSWSGPTLTPGTVVPVSFLIGTSCSSCVRTGSAFTFQQGVHYVILLVTARGNQFTFTLTV